MKKIVIAIVIFILTQLVCTFIAGAIILFPEMVSTGSFDINAITSIYASNAIQITLIGMIISQIATFIIFRSLNYYDAKDLIKKVPNSIFFISIPLIFSALMSLDIINSAIDLPNNLEKEFSDMTNSGLGFITMVLFAPILEELLFRKIVIDECRRITHRVWLSIVISAALFGVIHMNPAQMLFAFMAGAIFGWLYYRTGSVLPGIIGHIINNTFAFFDIKYRLSEQFYGTDEISFTDPKVLATFTISTIIAIGMFYLVNRFYAKKVTTKL